MATEKSFTSQGTSLRYQSRGHLWHQTRAPRQPTAPATPLDEDYGAE